MYRWRAGSITEADLSRFWPWTEDRSLIAEVSPGELESITTFTAPEPWLAWGTSSAPLQEADNANTPPRDVPTTIAVPRDYVDWATIQIGELLGRKLSWRPVEVRLRDAIRTALTSER